MVRPPKAPELRKDAQLRIPVTEAEKQLVTEAAKAAGLDMAPWARGVLLREAERRTVASTGKKARR